MKHKNGKKYCLPLMLYALLMAVGPASFASGSFSTGGNNGLQNEYNHGKIIYHKKLACKTCPLAGTQLDRNSAQALVQKFNATSADTSGLSPRERQAVIAYLSKRFDIH